MVSSLSSAPVDGKKREGAGPDQRQGVWDFFVQTVQDSWFVKQLRPRNSALVGWIGSLGAGKYSQEGKALHARWKGYGVLMFSAFGLGFFAARYWIGSVVRPGAIAIHLAIYGLCCGGFLWGWRIARGAQEGRSGSNPDQSQTNTPIVPETKT